MSLFKESGNDRFQRESQEMWNKISSEKTTKETEFSREKTTTTTSASQQKRTYEEQIGSINNRSGLLNQSASLLNGRPGLVDQSASLLNGGPGLMDQTNQNIGREGSRVGKIQRANGSDAQNDARTDVHNEQNARRERANVTNAHNEENIEEPFIAEVAHPRGAPATPTKPNSATPTKANPPTSGRAPPAKPQPVDIFPRRRTSKFVKSKPAIWENEEIIKPLFAIEKKSRNKQNNTQTKQTAVKCSKK